MAITYRIYKGSEKVVEGASPLTITGLDAGAKVAAGTYHIVRVQDEKESEKVAIPAFTVLVGALWKINQQKQILFLKSKNG